MCFWISLSHVFEVSSSAVMALFLFGLSNHLLAALVRKKQYAASRASELKSEYVALVLLTLSDRPTTAE